jgi:secondary thiamine-phosphate synthase enzyme
MAAGGLSWLLCLQACGCAEQQREQAEQRRESVQRFLHLYRWTFKLRSGCIRWKLFFWQRAGNRFCNSNSIRSEEERAMAMIKAHTEYLTFHTEERYEMVHITSQVEEVVRRSGIEDGLCFVSPMHITAAIYVNDNEDGLIEDIGTWLEKLAPAWPGYKHHRTGEDNADAHLKALLLHHETTLPVTHGRLDLGTWQRVFYAEFDGQRSKRVIVKLLGVAKG